MRVRAAWALLWVGLLLPLTSVVQARPPDVGLGRETGQRLAKKASESARADSPSRPFSEEEKQQLLSGESVKRKFMLEMDKVEYRAGICYRLVRASPMDVMRALRAPGGIKKAMPYGVEATTIREHDGIAEVRIVQGKVPIVGAYTVRMEWNLSTYSARFWLDPNQDHDLRDIWGAFSAREVAPGYTLVSFAVAFDLGGVAEILAPKAHRWALNTADNIAELVESPEPVAKD